MNKIFLTLLLTASVFLSAFIFIPRETQAAEMSVTQLIELLISIDVIAPEKAEAARQVAASLDIPIISQNPLPYLQVLKPNGGESMEMDLDIPYAFSWGASLAVPVNIALVPTKGVVCNLTPTPVLSRRPSDSMNVLLRTARCYDQVKNTSTPLVHGTYKMRVTYAGPKLATSTVIKDESDSAFTIKPTPVPAITVTYPNGGEKITRNDYYDIKYTVTDTTDEEPIYLSLINADGYVIKNAHKFGKNGVFELRIDSTIDEGLYKIRLKTMADDKTEIEDYSDTYFWISRQTL
jgi:hypothetical protein